MKEYDDLILAFENLLENYGILFSEISMVEDSYDLLYISSPDTYELYQLSGRMTSQDKYKNYKGKMCYKVLQGKDAPCDFCNNHLLTENSFYIWEHCNETVGKSFLIKDRLCYLDGKKMRVEVARDITSHERSKKILLDSSRQQYMLLRWMQLFLENDNQMEVFDSILRDLKEYFKANAGFIRAFTNVATVSHINPAHEALEEPFLRPPTEEELARWGKLIGENRQILIPSVAAIKEKDPAIYKLLAGRNVENMCMNPIFIKKKLVGFVCIGNIKENWNELPLIEMLSECIAISIQKKTILEEKYRMQYIDDLTGSMNLDGYNIQVEEFFRRHENDKKALYYFDIKKFKFINEVYGFDVGDRLLKYWSECMRQLSRDGEPFCRISGDTVSGLCTYRDESEVVSRFNKMTEVLTSFPELLQKRHTIELAGGVYLIQPGAKKLSLSEMLNRANMAEKSIKDQPGSNLAFYSEEMRQKEIREISFVANMKEALKKEEFLLYFQPQICTQSVQSRRNRAEVLVRWMKDGKMIAMPGEFIDLFERNGFIVSLDQYMFEHACKYVAQVREKYGKSLCLSVNVSKITMLQPGFVETYRVIKDKYHIEDGALELEFTESIAVENVNQFIDIIWRLKKCGFMCAMDDFGTGQSSLNVLQALPIDILKLDQRFFREKSNGLRKEIIVRSIVQMAKQLDMLTVAEGVEEADQVRKLTEMGCDYIQGYYFSKPICMEEFEDKYLKDSYEG